MAIRSFSIPEDSVPMDCQNADGGNCAFPSHSMSEETKVRKSSMEFQGNYKRRPISVIGGVNLYGTSEDEENGDMLQKVSPGA